MQAWTNIWNMIMRKPSRRALHKFYYGLRISVVVLLSWNSIFSRMLFRIPNRNGSTIQFLLCFSALCFMTTSLTFAAFFQDRWTFKTTSNVYPLSLSGLICLLGGLGAKWRAVANSYEAWRVRWGVLRWRGRRGRGGVLGSFGHLAHTGCTVRRAVWAQKKELAVGRRTRPWTGFRLY